MNIQESSVSSNSWYILGIIFVILLSIIFIIFIIYLKNKHYISEYLYHNKKKYTTSFKRSIINFFHSVIPCIVKKYHSNEIYYNLNTNCKIRYINDRLILLRFAFNDSKLNNMKSNFRSSYLYLLEYYLKDLYKNTALNIFLKNYSNALNIESNFNENNNILFCVKQIYKIVKGKNDKFKNIPFIYKNYRFKMIFLFELFFIRYLIGSENDNYDKINNLIDDFMLSYKEEILLAKFLHILNSNNIENIYDKVNNLISSSDNKYLKYASNNLLNNIKIVSDYFSLPVYNIGVFALMSAGKSTLFNALLGMKFIPSRRKACTAKITSISDNINLNSQEKYGGYYSSIDESYIFSNNIDEHILNNWNDDNNINNVFLESNIFGLDNKLLFIYDTPGVNNSTNEEHAAITKRFLENNLIDLYIYIVTLKKLESIDNDNFLNNIYKVYNKKSKIIFLINMIDEVNFNNGDSIEEKINEFQQYLSKIGFTDIIIIPTSLKAAEICKKIINGYKITIFEESDFINFYKKFKDDKMNLPLYVKNYNLYIDSEHVCDDNNVNVIVDNKEYRISDIYKLIDRTSINLIKNIIRSIVND
ncbi:dynamin family protein [uncultured Brachyspira sp.]|uniref:dynamin family protein n=1 Tax=uncultured Brachyspira sp. TaxID=221953 RepID=UPI002605DDB2|nr:dynamin family protein [uncultured Brachyspira sp.]